MQELERLDTMEEVADLGTSSLDTATGEIMDAPGPVEQPQPSPNGQQAAKPSQSAAGAPGGHRTETAAGAPGGHRTESAAGAATITNDTPEDDSEDPF